MLCYSFRILHYTSLGAVEAPVHPSKNGLARNMHILQDLAQNLASLALKMKLFLQDMKNLARILQENFAR